MGVANATEVGAGFGTWEGCDGRELAHPDVCIVSKITHKERGHRRIPALTSNGCCLVPSGSQFYDFAEGRISIMML
jgi:hypothetical protein